MPTLFQIKSFLNYWLEAIDKHALHSPFFFDLYCKTIRQPASPIGDIEQLREKLKNSHDSILFNDLGAGSKHKHSKNPTRKISDIAKTSLSPVKYASLYLRLVKTFEFKSIIELGTSLGINALYLGRTAHTKVVTFEGIPAIARLARSTFEFAQAENIRLIDGNIDTTLPAYLQTIQYFDLAFVDANHRYEPTIRYCNWLARKAHPKSVIIIDDIHASKEMEHAWQFAKQHSLVYASADLYRCGILFFDPSLNKQHVVLQF